MMQATDYPLEPHYVETEDGYILTLYRFSLPESKPSLVRDNADPNDKDIGSRKSFVERSPVLFMHGLGNSGLEWLCNRPEKVLPYLLADGGYDCWIACQRGSPLTGPKAHTKFTTKQKKYWDFCVDDFGHYDIPALTDYILGMTQAKSVFYIGHSLGITGLFVTLNSRPEYSSKIRLAVALAPAIFAPHCGILGIKLLSFNATHFAGKSRFLYRRGWYKYTCRKHIDSYLPCLPRKEGLSGWMFNFFGARLVKGYSPKQVEKERRPELAKYMPGRTSVKTICHILQNFNVNKFRAFDYGREENVKRYGTPIPKEYGLEMVNVPMAIFTSEKDYFIPAKDVLKMSKDLPNVVFYKNIKEKFGHGDFVFGKDADKLVYEDVLKLFNNCRN